MKIGIGRVLYQQNRHLTEFASSTQNPEKIYRNIKLTNQNEFFPKKVCLIPSKCKGAKNSHGGYPTKFAGSTQNSKKIIGTSIQPIRTKSFPKEVCLVP
jgi:hypothetical protein